MSSNNVSIIMEQGASHPIITSNILTIPEVYPAYNIIHVNKHPDTGQVSSKLELVIKNNDPAPPKYMSPQLRRANEDILKTLIMEYIGQLNTILAENKKSMPAHYIASSSSCPGLNENVLNSLSHRVKTPLTAIISGIQLMYNYEHNEFVSRILDYLMQSSVELTKFINDIIDYYYISQDILELDIEPTSMQEQIAYIYNVYASQLKEDAIKFTYSIDDTTVPAQFTTDKKRLSQIFINLLNNAINAVSQQSNCKKAINISVIAIKETIKDSCRLRVLIQDTGPGADITHMDMFFNPFQSTDNNQGFGLGLAITRLLLNKIGAGTIKFVNPCPGYNTAIEFEFDVAGINNSHSHNCLITEPATRFIPFASNSKPISSDAGPHRVYKKSSGREFDGTPMPLHWVVSPVQTVSSTAIHQHLPNKTYQVIIIDDNEKNMELLKLILERFSIQHKKNIIIKAFLNPFQAYEYLTNNADQIKLVFLDIKMPGMTGYDILSGLAKKYPAGSLFPFKIIIMSALPKPAIINKLAASIISSIQQQSITIAMKPFDIKELEGYMLDLPGTGRQPFRLVNKRITTVV